MHQPVELMKQSSRSVPGRHSHDTWGCFLGSGASLFA